MFPEDGDVGDGGGEEEGAVAADRNHLGRVEAHVARQLCGIEWKMGKGVASVLILGPSHGARNVLSYTGRILQHFLEFRLFMYFAFRDSPNIPLRRTTKRLGKSFIESGPNLHAFISSFLALIESRWDTVYPACKVSNFVY